MGNEFRHFTLVLAVFCVSIVWFVHGFLAIPRTPSRFFNRYLLLPFAFWQILLVRFVGFVFLYVSTLFVAYLLIFLFLPLFFFAFNPQFHFQDFDLFAYIPYFFFSWSNQVILLLPVFFFLFLFSTKITHLAVNILVLIGFIILIPRSNVFSPWFFVSLFEQSSKMIHTIFLPTGSGLYKMHELMELYGYSFVWTGLFVGILVYFSRFFYSNKN